MLQPDVGPRLRQATGVMFGTGAGIIYATPFGHGLQCSNSLDLIPVNWRPDFHWCRRVTAIEGLSWAMCKSSLGVKRAPSLI